MTGQLMNRRQFFRSTAGALAGASALAGGEALAQTAKAVRAATEPPATQPPLPPRRGQSYTPVVTLNGSTLPWKMNGGVKEFHLIAEPVKREFAPGFVVNCW